MKPLSIVAAVALFAIPVARCAPSQAKTAEEPRKNSTEEERSPLTQKQDPQPPPQITFPFPFFPFRPDASLTPGTPPFTFPFLFQAFRPRPSNLARSDDLSLDISDEFRKSPTTPNKNKNKKKKKQKKPKKPLVVYQKENQIALEGPPNFPVGFAGQFANGNQGSLTEYYMVYLVEVRWNGSNETQTIIAGRPLPTESAQITDLTGSLTESPYKPQPATTQCLFQRSTTGMTMPTDKPEIISEELEEYDEDDPKKKKKKQKTANAEVPQVPQPT